MAFFRAKEVDPSHRLKVPKFWMNLIPKRVRIYSSPSIRTFLVKGLNVPYWLHQVIILYNRTATWLLLIWGDFFVRWFFSVSPAHWESED